jgi:hypothetical protein
MRVRAQRLECVLLRQVAQSGNAVRALRSRQDVWQFDPLEGRECIALPAQDHDAGAASGFVALTSAATFTPSVPGY